MGLTVHLGHRGHSCPTPAAIVDNFTVVDTLGVHHVKLVYCGCVGAPIRRLQLLRLSWFPGSLDRPKTAFTFDVLNTFHLLNLQGKISLYDFYYAMEHKNDNAGLKRDTDDGPKV